jgi:hypothetical protein
MNMMSMLATAPVAQPGRIRDCYDRFDIVSVACYSQPFAVAGSPGESADGPCPGNVPFANPFDNPGTGFDKLTASRTRTVSDSPAFARGFHLC